MHIAATISVNQSTIGKFETGNRWPQDPDRIIGAYAEDLDIDAREIWQRALDAWARAGS